MLAMLSFIVSILVMINIYINIHTERRANEVRLTTKLRRSNVSRNTLHSSRSIGQKNLSDDIPLDMDADAAWR